jgi:hypothetical protein
MAMMRYTPATTSSVQMTVWVLGRPDPAVILGTLARRVGRGDDLANHDAGYGHG